MANDSTFGAPPERLRRLLIFGRDESNEHDQPTASWDILNEKPGSQIGRYRLDDSSAKAAWEWSI